MQVCQGCLIPMLLNIVAIEVLANFINTDKMIKGIKIGGHEIKIVNYADDTTISLWDITCLNMIQVILKLYENAKINYNTSHKFWNQPPPPIIKRCLQVLETVSCHKLRRCFSSNILQHWVGGEVWFLVYFCKVDHSRIFINFFRNWLGLNNLCEILPQNLRKLGK